MSFTRESFQGLEKLLTSSPLNSEQDYLGRRPRPYWQMRGVLGFMDMSLFLKPDQDYCFNSFAVGNDTLMRTGQIVKKDIDFDLRLWAKVKGVLLMMAFVLAECQC